MSHIPTLLIAFASFAQAADSAAPAALPQTPETQAAQSLPNTQPAEPPETEADKFVKAAAEKLDAIEYVSAKISQTIRAGGSPVLATGSYRCGPNYRSMFELDVKLGEATAKRINASDGKTGMIYEKLLDKESLVTFQIGEVMPLVENRELPPEVKRQVLLQLPFVKPGDMLRGYLESIRFDKMSDATLGENNRPVTLIEGSWKEAIVPVVAQNGNVKNVKDIVGDTPQFARLYLDKETSFPLRIELFRRDDKAEYKPIFVLDFLEVKSEKLPDSDFTFIPPEKLQAVDITSSMVTQLNQFPEKPGATSGQKPKTQEVAQPLTPTEK